MQIFSKSLFSSGNVSIEYRLSDKTLVDEVNCVGSEIYVGYFELLGFYNLKLSSWYLENIINQLILQNLNLLI